MGLLAGLLNRKKRGFIECEWVTSLDSNITSQLTAGYLDEESVVVGTANGKVYAINSSGKIKWAYSASEALSKEQLFFLEEEGMRKISSTPVIADINGDGKGEVIFGSEVGSLYALNHKGAVLWTFKANDAIKGAAFAYDINNDKRKELLFGSSDASFYALTNSGRLLWTFESGYGIESQPLVIDTKPRQIIFGANDGTIYSLSGKGKELWRFKTNDKVTAQPAVSFDYNSNILIVIGSQDNNLYALNTKGELQWSYETEGKIFSKAALADINNDKRNEIIVGSCDDKVHAVSSSGKKIWDYETNFWLAAMPIVEDFDNDNKLEIAAGSYDSFVYILEAEGEYSIGYMPGISGIIAQPGHYTDLQTSEPGSYIGKALARYKTDGMVIGQDMLRQNKSIIAASDIGKVYKLRFKKD